MGFWRIGIDELARGRFAVSPLIETTAALATLAGVEPMPGLRDWARTHRPAYRQRVAADPFAAAFVKAALRPRWVAHLLTVPPHRGDRSFHDELDHVRETPPATGRRDLLVDGRLASALLTSRLVDRAADLLEWVWTETVRCDWPRRRRIFEADIVSRTGRLSSGGWAQALDGLRTGMRWLDDGRLQINTYDSPPRTVANAELLFIPSTSPRGWVGWDEPHRYAIVYPCAGMLADPPRSARGALAKLIGPARARILVELEQPRSTSQLVALTGYGLGSVGGHLRVLLDSQLVQRRRTGRTVLYYRTRLGDQLAAAPTLGARPAPPKRGSQARRPASSR